MPRPAATHKTRPEDSPVALGQAESLLGSLPLEALADAVDCKSRLRS